MRMDLTWSVTCNETSTDGSEPGGPVSAERDGHWGEEEGDAATERREPAW